MSEALNESDESSDYSVTSRPISQTSPKRENYYERIYFLR